MSETGWLERASPPAWLGRPLTGRPDSAADGDATADFADIANLLFEMFNVPGGDELNALGFAGTAVSQYRQSTAENPLLKFVEAGLAGYADYKLGNVPVLGPALKKAGAELLARLITANTQPLLDTYVLKPLAGFSLAEVFTGFLRVSTATLDDVWSGRTRAVARLQARADMGNASSTVARLVNMLRRDGS